MSEFTERKRFWDEFNVITNDIEGLKPEEEIVVEYYRDSFELEHKELLTLARSSKNLLLDDEAKEVLREDINKKVCDATSKFGGFVEVALESNGERGISNVADVYAQAVVDAERLVGLILINQDHDLQKLQQRVRELFAAIFREVGEENESAVTEIEIVYQDLIKKICTSTESL